MQSVKTSMKINTKKRKISFAKWGYIFLIPFFTSFLVFTLIPLCETIFDSFFLYYTSFADDKTTQIFEFAGFDNYKAIFADNIFWKYFGNTAVIWLLGFVPQIIISLALAVWFTDMRLKLKGTGFFKAVMYMPNLVMAAAFGMLFLMLFAQNGPISSLFKMLGWIGEDGLHISDSIWGTRGVIALINFLMWFGNTTILLMAGVMGIDPSIYEAATIDGAGAWKTFKDITMPLLAPILTYVLITSLIGGIQLFDTATIFTETKGGTDMTSYTLIMWLNTLLGGSKNYGQAGALSVMLFIMTAVLSFFVFLRSMPENWKKDKKKAAQKKASVKNA